MLKRSLILALCSASIFAVSHAQSDSSSAPSFADMKAQVIARLETQLSCVQAATTAETLRACRPQPPSGRQGPPPSQ